MNTSRLKQSLLTLSLLAATGLPAMAQTVDVQQYWTSASESKAMNAIADAFKARGGKWIDSPSAGFDAALAAAMSRIAGGEPPSALLMTPSAAMRDLAAAGQLRTLDDLAEKGGWQKVMPPIVWEKLTVDGKLVALPVGIHADNWVFYSKPVFDKLGLAEPKTYDEMFAAADKIKEAGLIAFAVGGESWQESAIFENFLLGLGGPGFWNELMINRDPEAAKSPMVVKAFEMFRKVSSYTDPASPGRAWNDTTNLVIADKAGMQFMGDWARGEFLAAGKVAGKDFGCFISLGDKPAYAVVVDVFAFPVNTDEDRIAGQTLLAGAIMDGDVQASISEAKGSIPSRSDVDTSKLDACATAGVKTLAQPGAGVLNAYDALPGDMNGQMTDLLTQFWTDPSITVDTAVERLSSILAAQ